MTESPVVVGVPGSVRDGSYTRTTTVHALRAAEDAGAEAELVDPQAYDLPLFDPDLDDDEQGDAALVKRKIRAADGVILGSPVYHGSYSSAFRNVHDYCGFDEFEDTVVGLVVVAGGGTIASALDHMRSTVRGVHGWVVPHQVGIRNAYDQFEDAAEPLGHLADGTPIQRRFLDEDLEERVQKLGRQVVENLKTETPPEAESATADD